MDCVRNIDSQKSCVSPNKSLYEVIIFIYLFIFARGLHLASSGLKFTMGLRQDLNSWSPCALLPTAYKNIFKLCHRNAVQIHVALWLLRIESRSHFCKLWLLCNLQNDSQKPYVNSVQWGLKKYMALKSKTGNSMPKPSKSNDFLCLIFNGFL